MEEYKNISTFSCKEKNVFVVTMLLRDNVHSAFHAIPLVLTKCFHIIHPHVAMSMLLKLDDRWWA